MPVRIEPLFEVSIIRKTQCEADQAVVPYVEFYRFTLLVDATRLARLTGSI